MTTPEQPEPQPIRQRVDDTVADSGTLVDMGLVEESPEPAPAPPPEPAPAPPPEPPVEPAVPEEPITGEE